LVSMAKPGDKVTLEVWRVGKKAALNATLTEAKDTVAANEPTAGNARGGKLGVAVRPLTPEERSEAKLGSGVLVEQVTGRAAKAGIEPGDVILSINGTPVKTVEQLQSLIAKESKHLALLIQRGEEKIFVPVALG
jgi:serine protease Do